MRESPWKNLRKRGDWMVVWGKTPDDVSNSLRQYFTYNFSREVVYKTATIPDGVFIVLAHMPEGLVEEYEARKGKICMDQQERAENLNANKSLALRESFKENSSKPEEDDDYDPMAEHDGEYGIGDESD